MAPETRYARSADVSIAYQVAGDGPFDLVFVPPSTSHVELGWEVPSTRALFGGLASFARLIFFDKRGTGMSDRVVGAPALETRMDDVRAVMDVAGSERAALIGWSEGVAMCALFAATYPDRAWALVLYGGCARELRAPDYPWGPTEAEALRMIEDDRRAAERPAFAEELARSRMTAEDEEIAAFTNMIRQSISPGAAEALDRMNIQIDFRHVLPATRVPTLVLHNTGDRWVEVERGRDLADRIPGAEFVEFPVEGHITPAADVPRVLGEIKRFLEAAWDADSNPEPDRQLATLLFTDIVDSTSHLAKLGDAGWRELLEQHHAVVRTPLARARGREVDTGGRRLLRVLRRAGARRTSRQGDRRGRARAGHRRPLGTAHGRVRARRRQGLRHRRPHRSARRRTRRPWRSARLGHGQGPGRRVGPRVRGRGVHELKGIPGEWRLYAAV